MKYLGFISYSHADTRVATRLHRWLESYRVPKRLVGRSTPFGPVPRRLHPVFRDREELPTSADLGSQIQAALAESATLIVVCSPRAAASRWVNEEILAFKRLGRHNRILCLIVDGEPNATDKPGRAEEGCFPPALRFQLGADGQLTTIPAEPIAADLRPGKDGQRDAFLKLAAGVAAVGFDELRQRELQRQVRRWIRISIASAALLLLTIGLTVFAVVSRSEAIAQREIAREQRSRAQKNFRTARASVDRFLTRVSEEELFRTNGMQPLQKKLLEDALEYYRQFLRDQDQNPEVRAETAAAYERVGNVTDLIGDRQEALAAYRQSIAIWEELVREGTGEDDFRLELSSCLADMGTVLWHLGRAREALDSLERALALADDLIKANPGEEKFAEHWKIIVLNLGPYQKELGEIATAEATYQAAWDTWEKTEGSRPRRLGLSFEKQNVPAKSGGGLLITEVSPGTAADVAGMRPGDKLVTLAGRLVIDVASVRELTDKSRPGDTLTASVRRDAGVITLDLKLQERVDFFAAVVAYNAGTLYKDDFGNLAEAFRWYERAREQCESVLLHARAEQSFSKDSSQLSTIQDLLCYTYGSLGVLESRQGNVEQAIEHLERDVALRADLADKNPTITDYADHLALAYTNLASMWVAVGKYDEARNLYEKSIAIFERLVEQQPTTDKFLLQLGVAHQNLATMLVEQGTFPDASAEYERALKEYRILRKRNREDPSVEVRTSHALMSAGWALLNQRRFREAESHYSEALEIQTSLAQTLTPAQRVELLDHTITVHDRLAAIHDEMEMKEQAARDRTRAAEVRQLLIDLLAEQFEAAEEKSSLRIDLASALNNVAMKLMDDGRNANARELFNRMIEVFGDPAEPGGLTDIEADLVARGHGNLGWIDLLEGRLEQAIERSSLGVRFDDKQEWIRQNLATAHLCAGHTEKALEIFRPLLQNAADKAGFLKALDADFTHLRAVGVSHPGMEEALRTLRESLE